MRAISLLCLCFFSASLCFPLPVQADSVKMLPPEQSDLADTVCKSSQGNKILTWDGQNALKCRANTTISDAGNLSVKGSAYISRDGAGECCSLGNTTLSLAENTLGTGRVAGLQFHNAGVSEAYFRLANGGQRRFQIGDNQGVTAGLQMTGPLYVDNVGTSYFSGNVGVGTTAPAAKLDVAGGVKIGSDVAACTAAKAGTVRWTGTAMEYCNGSAWAPFGGSPDCQVYQADTAGILTGGTKVVHSFEMVTFTCPANRPQMTSGSCWRKSSGTFIGTHNMEDGRSYRCRIEGGGGLDIWATCCK